LVFLRGVSGADVVAVCWVRLVVVMPTDCASAAVAVGATSRGLSDRDSRADASADMAVSMAVITEMRPSIKSRPNSFMDFLAAKRRVAESAPVSILFATNLVAIVRAPADGASAATKTSVSPRPTHYGGIPCSFHTDFSVARRAGGAV